MRLLSPFAQSRRSAASSVLAALLLWLAPLACAQAPRGDAQPSEPATGVVAFVGVNVLPMTETGERILPRHTVVVQDGRITAVGPADQVQVPAGAVRVEGQGRYLMPGLAEMHGHIPGPQNPQYAENVLFLYVSNGVTTVRGMAGHPYHLELRERVERAELLGPTIYAAGPGFGGGNVPDPEAAERLVREQHAAGYDLLKVFGISREAYARMAQTAHQLGIPFAGHVPASVGLEGALEHRQSSIDHLDRYVEFLVRDNADIEARQVGFFGSGVVDLVDPAKIPVAAQRTREVGIWNVPTLSLVEHLASAEPPEQMIQWPEMRYMPQQVLDGWVRSKHDFQGREYFQPEAAQRLVEVRRQLTRALHDAGAPLALGSDAPQFFNVPGFSIHHEMEMMVGAGLTPYEVLVTGTRNPALYFETPAEFGTVEVGRRADLILLEANPADDIGNVRRRAGVMVRGRWLPEAEIQQRLEQIATQVRQAS
jgi:cytosine/adenosine deaminase-related metal-dependent hydrolase